MPDTLVIQSHRTPLPYPWIERCLASVRAWCGMNRYGYRFLGDELFTCLPGALRHRTRRQTVIATDLARLCVLQAALSEQHRTVIWLDADTLVFEPATFVMPDSDCAVGREVWVQRGRDERLRVYRKVHNAFLLFRRGNSFLDFYADTAQRLLALNRGPIPPQFLGPKLLSALHNVAQLPVLESAGMLSPLVCRDIIRGDGAALQLFRAHSPQQLAAANLCISSCERGELAAADMERVIDRLLGGALCLPGGTGM